MDNVATIVRGTAPRARYADDEVAVLAGVVPDGPVVDPAARVGETYDVSAAFGVAGATVETDPVTLVASIDLTARWPARS